MFRINEPIRAVRKDNDNYEFVITREFKKFKVNKDVFDFIQYLREKKLFEKNIIETYALLENISNKEDYYDFFDILLDNNFIV